MIFRLNALLRIGAILASVCCCTSCRNCETEGGSIADSSHRSSETEDWATFNDLAVSHHHAKDYEAAIKNASKAIEIDPTQHVPYFNRAWSYKRVGKFDAALADLSTAIELSPTPDSGYYTMRGATWYDKREFAHAIDDCAKAIETEPDCSPAFCLRANALVQLGEYDAALRDFLRAIDFAPEDELAHNDIAWLLATCPEENIRDGELALKHAMRANELREWNDYLYWDSLAAAYAEIGEYEKAIEWITKAMEASPPEDQHGLRLQLNCYNASKPFRDVKMSFLYE